MVDNKYIISILQQAKSSLQENYGIRSLALFGSYSRNTTIAKVADDLIIGSHNTIDNFFYFVLTKT
jgi:predicted nucleotidyltransferase